MKNRKKLAFDDALELCGQMLLDGWEKLRNEFKESKEMEKVSKFSEGKVTEN